MIRDITIGRYYDSESVIHRMDPRTKLMGVLVYIISLFLVKNVWWYLGCLIVMLVLYRLARVPVGYLLKGLRGILILLCFTFHTRTYTFSLIFLPRIPVGFTNSTMISTENTMASESWEEIYALERISITPKRTPPIKAPGMDPIPPNTAATNALIPGMEPVYGVKDG